MGTVASTAMAANPFDTPANDPNTTNVPYLAWRGENIRLVDCLGTDDFNKIRTPGAFAGTVPLTDADIPNVFKSIIQTNVQLEDWSGTGIINSPKEVINGARTFLWYNARTLLPVICFQDTFTSQSPGLAIFKLTVSFGLTDYDSTGVSLGAQVLVLQHQWTAGWMTLGTPTLDEVTSIDPKTAPGINPEGLGDANGDGTFFAGDDWVQGSDGTWSYTPGVAHPGEIRATVNGTLPLTGGDFGDLGIGTTLTLPDQWSTLAKAWATDGDVSDTTPWMRWDIHDELVNEQGVTTTVTGGRTNPTTDNVKSVIYGPNNTLGNSTFTRILSGFTAATSLYSDYPTSGPFDPNFAEQTLLPDGQLNAGDAPMPPARIDFSIAPNTNPLTSIDGVGSLGSDSKAHDYSLDYTGSNNSQQGNLFAPYYSQWIPATARDDLGYASGIDGALATDNFPGFLTSGDIPDWTAIDLGGPTSTTTGCQKNYGQYRTTPGGAQTVAVYSDEHGEARATYYPGGNTGNDFYFDALNTTPTDANHGCDLLGIKNDILGTSAITAVARYPYQKVTDPDHPSKTTLPKTVYSLFDKHLSYYPKNYTPSSAGAKYDKIVVAHAQDINGQPFGGEQVCFSGSYPSGAAISGFFPTGDSQGNFGILLPDLKTTLTVHINPQVPSPRVGYVCTHLDSAGNAAFEVTGSAAGPIDVLVYFPDEGLFRDIEVDTAATSYADNPNLSPSIVLAGGASTTGAGTNGTTAPSTAKINSIVTSAVAGGFGLVTTGGAGSQTITPSSTITVKKTAIKLRLLTMRLVRPAHGKAYFLVKVQSPKKTAKITVAFKNGKGHTLTKFTKTVKTNKLVKIETKLLKLAVKKLTLVTIK